MAASFNIMNCLKTGESLPQEIVNYMYETGGFLVFKDFPEGNEFGIDYKSWQVGPKFLGIKMIPPGVHYVYCSMKGAPRIGFFHNFKPHEIMVKTWEAEKEDFSDEEVSEEEIQRLRCSLKNIDGSLAPYPYETYRNWYALTDFVNGDTLKRLNPLKGRISAQAELVSMETVYMEDDKLNEKAGCSRTVDREHPMRTRFVDQQGLPIMKVRPGYEIRFQEVPQLAVSADQAGIDYTNRLERVLARMNNEWRQLLAECQYAFACFLIGQVYEGFEQWKRLIHLLCSCPTALKTKSDVYMQLMRVLHFQLKECPTDFFIDIISKDNFLTTTLSMLFANIKDSDDVSQELKKKSLTFKAHLTKTFKWDFECD